jgi:hypothetical protein
MPTDQLTPEWSSQKINTSFTRKKKGSGHASKTLDLGGQRFACKGF